MWKEQVNTIFSTDGIKGFRCEDREVKIYDQHGKPFYFFTLPEIQRHVKFNLPKGKYFTQNTLSEVNPVKYDLPKLPARERYSKVEVFPITISENPNKCSINFTKKIIIIDPELTKLPAFILYYILEHERGHFYYETEKYADLFAAYQMLKNGFNPSQIAQANNITLTYSPDRKKFAVDTARKYMK
jgi:hypothetical protein